MGMRVFSEVAQGCCRGECPLLTNGPVVLRSTDEHQAEKAGDAAMDRFIVTAERVAERAAYAAALAECEARDVMACTVHQVMLAISQRVNLFGTAHVAARDQDDAVRRITSIALDRDGQAAFAAAMKVFYYATPAFPG